MSIFSDKVMAFQRTSFKNEVTCAWAWLFALRYGSAAALRLSLPVDRFAFPIIANEWCCVQISGLMMSFELSEIVYFFM